MGGARDRGGGEPGPADRVGAADRADGVELLADADRPGSWVLLAGGVLQSHVDPDNPQHLELEYVRRIGHLIDAAAPPGLPLRALHLGGGGLTLARYVAETRPGSAQLAVESDPRVVGLVRSRLPLDGPGEGAGHLGRSRSQPGRPGTGKAGAGRPGTGRPGTQEPWRDEPGGEPRWIGAGIRVRVGDARAVLEQVPAGSFDVLVADVFVGGSTPAHVTSVEFTAAVARALAPSGIYIANIGDGPVPDSPVSDSPHGDGLRGDDPCGDGSVSDALASGDPRGDGLMCDGPASLGSAGDSPVSRSAPLAHTRGRVAAARSVFACVYLIAEPAVLRGRRFGNLVLAAADHELPVERLTRRFAADPFPARLLEGAEVDRFVAGSPPITDASAQPSPTPPPDAFI